MLRRTTRRAKWRLYLTMCQKVPDDLHVRITFGTKGSQKAAKEPVTFVVLLDSKGQMPNSSLDGNRDARARHSRCGQKPESVCNKSSRKDSLYGGLDQVNINIGR